MSKLNEEKTVGTQPLTLRPSNSICVLLATGALSVLLLFLDRSPVAYNEFVLYALGQEIVLYALGLSGALVYVHYVASKRRMQQKTCKIEGDDAESPSSVSVVFGQLQALKAAARSKGDKVDKVRSLTAQLLKDLTPPAPQRRTPGQDKPVVPAWAVCALVLVLAAVAAAVVGTAFYGAVSQEVSTSFLDAAPTACGPDGKPLKKPGFSIRASMGWLTIAFSLASGLCSVHPLQSGLTMAI